MKFRYFLLFPLVLLAASCGANEGNDNNGNNNNAPISDKIQVVILLGQSNMEGHSYVQYLPTSCGEEKASEYVNGFSDVKISYWCSGTNNSNGQFVDVKAGQGTNAERFGPEVGIADYVHNHYSDLSAPVYLIKYAQGATSIFNQWQPPSTGRTGALFGGAIDYINECLTLLEEEGYYPEIKAICWMQGEDDSNNNNYLQYGEYQEAFINDLREELLYYSRPEGIGFIDAGISDSPAWLHYPSINQQKEKISKKSPLNKYFSTIENDLKYNQEPQGVPDIYHFDSASMIKLGNLFAQNLFEFLE